MSEEIKNDASDKTERKQRSLANLIPYKPGQSGNPNGRPVGTLSLKSLLKEELAKEIERGGEKVTYAKALIDKILKKAIVDEDAVMMKDIQNRVDGMPEQPMRHSGTIEATIQLEQKTIEIIKDFVEFEKKKIK